MVKYGGMSEEVNIKHFNLNIVSMSLTAWINLATVKWKYKANVSYSLPQIENENV